MARVAHAPPAPKTQDEIRAEIARISGVLAEHDPFYAYVPSTGQLDEERLTFLRSVIQPEHWPQTFYGQVDIHKAVAPKLGISGGNRASKTTTACIEDYIFATGEVPPSMKAWYPKAKLPTRFPVMGRVVAVDDGQLHNTVLPIYQHWVPRRFLKKGSWEESYASKHDQLTLYHPQTKKKCAVIEFKTGRQEVESFQGPPLDFLTLDEECPEAIWKENLLRFATTTLRVKMAWTPTRGLTWSHKVFGLASDGNTTTKLFKLASVTNPRVKVSELKAILCDEEGRAFSYDELRMRLLGDMVSLSGLVYGDLFDRHVHVVAPFDLPTSWLVVRGLDPHMAKPTACVFAAIDREEQVYVFDAYYENHDIDTVKADIARMSQGRRLGWSVCDKSADSDHQLFRDMSGLCRNIYKELTRGAHAITPLWKSEKYTGSIVAGVDELKKALKLHPVTKKPKLVIFDLPQLRPLIEAFQSMERDAAVHEEKSGVRDRIREGPHDLHACLRYIYQYPIRWVPEQQYVPELQDEGAVATY